MSNRIEEIDEELGRIGEEADNLETAVSVLTNLLADGSDVEWHDIEPGLSRIDFDKALRKAERLFASANAEIEALYAEMAALEKANA